MENDTADMKTTYVAELRGFLNALQRFCGPLCSFFVDYFLVESNMERSIQAYFARLGKDFNFIRCRAASYEEIKSLLDMRVFSRFTVHDDTPIKRELAWQLIEYYGLMSTAVNKKGKFNALVSGSVFVLDVECVHYESSDYFLVLIEDFAVITSFANRYDDTDK